MQMKMGKRRWSDERTESNRRRTTFTETHKNAGTDEFSLRKLVRTDNYIQGQTRTDEDKWVETRKRMV